jgi:Helix-turn-helix domain
METATAEKTTFLTQPEVAEMLHHATTATLRWWRHEDRGPRSIRVGRRVLYRRMDVELWLEAQENETARGGVR